MWDFPWHNLTAPAIERITLLMLRQVLLATDVPNYILLRPRAIFSGFQLCKTLSLQNLQQGTFKWQVRYQTFICQFNKEQPFILGRAGEKSALSFTASIALENMSLLTFEQSRERIKGSQDKAQPIESPRVYFIRHVTFFQEFYGELSGSLDLGCRSRPTFRYQKALL